MAKSKAPKDPRGGHVRLYWDVMDSVAWRALSYADRGLWLAMRRKLLSANNGNIEATLGELRRAGFTSSATLAKGLRALIAMGFIAKTRQGGVAYGQKVCSLYRFTDEATYEQKRAGVKAMQATFDWRKFETVREAKAVLAAAHAAAKRDHAPIQPLLQEVNNSAASEFGPGLQILNDARSETEPKAGVVDSIPEAADAVAVHRLKQAARHQIGRRAARTLESIPA
jgi:hypothetical protein